MNFNSLKEELIQLYKNIYSYIVILLITNKKGKAAV